MTITSEFTVGVYHSMESARSIENNFGPLHEVRIGDSSKTVGPDVRFSSVNTFNLNIADVGFEAIPKNAIIENVRWEFMPAVSTAVTALNGRHRLGLMASDGYWDMSRQSEVYDIRHPLTFNARSMSAATQKYSVLLHVDNEALSEIADTVPSASLGTLTSHAIGPEVETFGSTVMIPAGETIGRVRMGIGRVDAVFGQSFLSMDIYELSGNARHYTPTSIIATSDNEIGYTTISATGEPELSWTFDPVIPSVDYDRWVGAVIGGSWWSGNTSGRRIRVQVASNANNNQANYLTGTAGSMLSGSADSSRHLLKNSLNYFYIHNQSTPCMYTVDSGVELTSPYQRWFGEIMLPEGGLGFDVSDWTLNVLHSYGSPGSNPTDIFDDVVENVQAWIDSEFFQPAMGSAWIGLIMEIQYPDNVIWKYDGTSGNNLTPMKMIIDWTPRRVSVV